MDRDTLKKVADFTFSGLSNDGYKETDFSLISLKQTGAGVDVPAAADGRAQSLCDEMADQNLSSETLTKNKGEE